MLADTKLHTPYPRLVYDLQSGIGPLGDQHRDGVNDKDDLFIFVFCSQLLLDSSQPAFGGFVSDHLVKLEATEGPICISVHYKNGKQDITNFANKIDCLWMTFLGREMCEYIPLHVDFLFIAIN